MSGEARAVEEALTVYIGKAFKTDNVPPGYKQTEVEVIPEDWTIAKLDHLAELTSSRRIFEHEYVSSGVPFYRGKEISLLVNREPITDPYFISEKRYNDLVSQYGAPTKGDILITAVGTLGNIYVVPEDSRFYFKDGNLIWLRKITAESEYVAAQLRRARTRIISESIGSSQSALTIVVLKDVQIPMPSPREQRAIAAALSDVDSLIFALDTLISKKQAVKTAAKQQLLTGKRRLPGFSGEWETQFLGQHIERLDSGVSVNSFEKEVSGQTRGAYILKTSAVSNGRFFPSENKTIVPEDVRRARLNPLANTIIISRMNTIDLVGEVGYVERNYPNLFLPDRLWMARFFNDNQLSVKWLSYVLASERYKNKIKNVASGTSGSMKNISQNALLKMTVELPSVEEQTAIATVLSDIDAEISALEARREKTRQVKQGMMQELLTGRTRLVPEGSFS